MYIDVVIIVVLLVLSVFVFRRFSSFIYSFVIIDLFLRILNFIAVNGPFPDIQLYILNYLPASMPSIADNYLKDAALSIFMWIYVGIYVCFLYYITKYLIKKKK